MAVATQTAIIGAEDHLKCKLLSGTLKDAAPIWYMILPKNSIENWTDFQRKFTQQFAGSKHVKVTATSLFSMRQNHNESLHEYLARFCEATSKVCNPNQEMFVSAFHHAIKAGHFNESLAQKSTTSMQEVTRRAEGCIKGEESNAKKRMRDARERGLVNKGNGQSEFYHQQRRPTSNYHGAERHRKPYQPPRHFQEGPMEKKVYIPLNRARVYILDEILETGLGKLPPQRGKEHTLGMNPNA
ncbi:hypothetical protein QL285_038914 [Trifolium repens]|nr:hypothetical protein QL285_038914 [Trifolium repens]